MQHLKTLIILFLLLLSLDGLSQDKLNYEEVNNHSFALYEKGSWAAVLEYGNNAVNAGQDFTLLRLRMGYAAFMISNFSQAIIHYEQVLKNDSFNSTAHYYIWLCRTYLNQTELAALQIPFLSDQVVAKEKKQGFVFTGAELETSFKATDVITRGNTFYQYVGVQNRFGSKITMDMAGAYFNQSIKSLPTGAPAGAPLKTSSISQSEYYNKLTFNLDPRWQIKAAYHYANTVFDISTYQNHAIFGAIKYHGNYFDVQVEGIYSKMFDTSISQASIQMGYYPMGNLNFYGISNATLRNRPGQSGFNFKQVLGAKVYKGIWLEANATLGKFRDLFENDAKYLYNAPDQNNFKAGLVSYISLSPKCTLELGYTLEQRAIVKNPNTLFTQHSITGGLSWKF
jgi:tetratricopeptide (TPR) repeat protein